MPRNLKPIYSLGVMTGTSCDGADLALLRLVGCGASVSESLEHTESQAFPSPLRARLREAQKGALNIGDSTALARDYSLWIGRLCSRMLASWRIPLRNALVAVHGQTAWHAPDRGISAQLVEPSIIAHATACTVASAFRQPDLARGGQGAPLVPLYHWLKATSSPYADLLPFAIHNVGGIANLTYITRDKSKLLAFDTGPGNALIDLAAEDATNGRLKYDRDGKLALSAVDMIDWKMIERMGQERYFRKKPPKSTGRELFNQEYLRKIPGKGAARVANATALTAHSMATAYADFILKGGRELHKIFVAGGGARNPALIRLFKLEIARLASRRRITISVLPDSFAPPQFLEAMSFARLGFEALQGRPVSLAAVTGASEDAFGSGIFAGANYRHLLSQIINA